MKTLEIPIQHVKVIHNENTKKIRTGSLIKPFLIIIMFLALTLLSSCIFIPLRGGGGGHRGGGGGEHERGGHR